MGGHRVDHVPGDLDAHVAHVFGSALERPRPCPVGEPGTCSPVPVLWLTRLCSAGVGVLSGLLYATGGHDGPLVRKSVEVYDPGTNTWKQVADMNMCRRNAGNHDKPFCGGWLSCLCVVFNAIHVLVACVISVVSDKSGR